MKFLFDFFPILLFFIAYQLYDMFVATAVIIIASVLQVTVYWYKHRKFEKMHIIALFLVVLLGGATIIFQNEIFIKWKPSVVNWMFAIIFLISHFIDKKTVIQRMLGRNISLPITIWKRLNISWVTFFLLMGIINVYVAFYYGLDLSHETRNDIWVNFKLFGMLGLTMAFTFGQAFYFAPHMQKNKAAARIEKIRGNP